MNGTPGALVLTPLTADLGSVAIGTTGPSVTFTLHYSRYRSGDVAMGPFAITLSSAEFVITDDTCSTSVIPDGGTCTISIALRPISVGAKSATLIVAPLSGNLLGKTLTGTGISISDGGLVEPMDSGIEQGEAGNIAIDGNSG
jgi:hypothetical protein